MGRITRESGLEQVAPIPKPTVPPPLEANPDRPIVVEPPPWSPPSIAMPVGHGRELHPKLESKLDELVELNFNEEFRQAIERRKGARLVVMALQVLEGVREFPKDSNRGDMVELLQETIGRAEREPWCMALVQSGVAYAEKKTGIVSKLPFSEHCLTVWNQSPVTSRISALTSVKAGDIAIWNYPPGSAGHTGVVRLISSNRQTIELTEGNTTQGLRPDGSIEREGGGVYRTKRSTTFSGPMKLVGFIRAFRDEA